MENFIEQMQDILDCDQQITMESALADIEEWDSLSYVSFIAMANASYGKKVDAKIVKEAETIGDLYNLVK